MAGPLRAFRARAALGVALLAQVSILAFSADATPPTAHYPGKWTPVSSDWPAIAVHMMLVRDTTDTLHHSEIIWWNSEDDHFFHGGRWAWKPNDTDLCQNFPTGSYFDDSDSLTRPGSVSQVYDPFCGAHTQTALGKLLVVGGTEHGEVGVTITQLYDPNTNTWSPIGNMTNPRWYGTATALPDGRVVATSGSKYVHLAEFGGKPPGGGSPNNELRRVGMLLSGQWDSAITMTDNSDPWPDPREGHTFVNDHVFGGRDTVGEPRADVYTLSRDEQPYSTDYGYHFHKEISITNAGLYANPLRRADHSAVEALRSADTGSPDDGMIVFGGTAHDTVLADAYRLHSVGAVLRWDQLTLAAGSDGSPTPRFGHVAMYDPYHHRMLVFGGDDTTSSGFATDASVWALDLSNPSGTCTWSKPHVFAPNGAPGPLIGAAFAVDTRLETRAHCPDSTHSIRRGIAGYLFGGESAQSAGSVKGDIWQLWVSPNAMCDTVEWVQLAPDSTAPSGRAWANAVYDETQQRIVFLGGQGGTGVTGKEIYGLDLGFQISDVIPGGWHYTWQHLNDLPESSGFSHGAAIQDKEVFARDEEIADLSGSTPSWSIVGANVHHLDNWYPFMFVTPSGKVFDAGSGNPADFGTSQITLGGSPSWDPYPSSDTNDYEAGSAAMYRPGMVMKCGSRELSSGQNSVTTTKQIDLTAGTPAWAPSANEMVYGRINHNLVILPTGEVMVTGGTLAIPTDSVSFIADGAPRPELWDPTYVDGSGHVGYWYSTTSRSAPNDSLAKSHLPRDYHGTAILLPDGRVLQAGGNTRGVVRLMDQEAEIYCPPYLFDTTGAAARRPILHGGPDKITYQSVSELCLDATMTSDDIKALDRVVLIKPGAATHGFDQDQRYVPLSWSYCGSGSKVQIYGPVDANTAPPGDYLLFLVYKKDVPHGYYGTPSIAKWVRVGGLLVGNTQSTCDSCPPGGGCPVAESRAVSGWSTENTILARSADGTAAGDALLLTHTPAPESGRLTIRIRENEYELTTLDRAQLAVIDHPPGTEAFASGSRVVVGAREGAYRVTTSRGDDITGLVNGGPAATGWTGQAGDVVTVEMDSPVRIHRPGVDRGIGAVAAGLKDGPSGGGGASLRPTGATTNRDAPWLDQTGILIQLPDGAGGWRTTSHQYPREKPDASLVDSLAHGTYRLVFVGRHHLSFLGRIVPSTSGVTTETLSPVSAMHTRLGDVLAAASGNGASTSLAPGDTLTLSFSAPKSMDGMVRDVVLLTHGVYSSNLSDRRGLPVGATLPAQFALEQNVPNPFSSTTTIRFALPTASRVKIEVFDLFGRRIRTLTDTQWSAGYHQVEWDRRDASGNTLHSGVFMYRMSAGTFTDHKKLVITGN